jgi:uncharacterized protein
MDLVLNNLISPVVLSFALGMIARAVRSDLEIPSAVYQALSIYLLFAIGLKGGVALSNTSVVELAKPVLATILLGLITPMIAFYLLRGFGKISRIDAAATAAHYGSVSAVTFLAALEAIKIAGFTGDGFLPALVALLEIPGIIVGLLLARQNRAGGIKSALHEVLTGKSIFLLIGGMAIGALCGAEKIDTVAPFFIVPFKGVLCLFLLELGIVAASRLSDMRQAGWRLIIIGCVLPVINGLLGCTAGTFAGMTPGGAAVLGAMSGSASYIAAPAAVRIALPKASPGIYLTLSLGVTFPFNLTIGIPMLIKYSEYLNQLLS